MRECVEKSGEDGTFCVDKLLDFLTALSDEVARNLMTIGVECTRGIDGEIPILVCFF